MYLLGALPFGRPRAPWPRPVNCQRRDRVGSVTNMADSVLQQQLDEVRELLRRARELFGANPIEPPADIAPKPGTAREWVR